MNILTDNLSTVDFEMLDALKKTQSAEGRALLAAHPMIEAAQPAWADTTLAWDVDGEYAVIQYAREINDTLWLSTLAIFEEGRLTFPDGTAPALSGLPENERPEARDLRRIAVAMLTAASILDGGDITVADLLRFSRIFDIKPSSLLPSALLESEGAL